MKILVPVKRVVSPYEKIRIKSDGTGIDTQHAKMVMNPFDEIALEEAVRLKEQQLASDIVVVSIGSSLCQETLRMALAIGADRALLIQEEEELEPISIAKILLAIVQEEKPQLVIMGKQSIDGDHNQTGQMLAGLLAWSQGTFISQLRIEGQQIMIRREVDGGLETLNLDLPAVLTTDLRLNEPRYATLPNIMKAKQKPLQIRLLSDLNLTLKKHFTTLAIKAPAKRQMGQRVASVDELVNKLKYEAKVI